MKTIFRNLGLGVLMTGCIVVAGNNAFAQNAAPADVCKETEQQQALYAQFTNNIPPAAAKPTLDQTKAAIKAGDDYVQKYGNCPDSKQIADYLNKYLPGMKDSVKRIEGEGAKNAVKLRFSDAAKAKNTADIFSVGKEILGKESDFSDVSLDVALTMVSAGFDQSIAKPPVNTYNADTINYAKNAIQKIESGKTSENWGVWSYNFKNPKFKDNKAYTLGTLNYIIGNIIYFNQGQNDVAKKKEALPYFYKATQYDSIAKTDPIVYQAIGAWYLEEAIRIDKERQEILKTQENKDNERTLAMVGEQKGYADRAIDAYSRAYKLTKSKTNPDKAAVDNLYARLKELYGFRFDGKVDGMDAAIAKADSTPFPDPTTPITPVVVEPTEPATAPSTTGATTPPAADTTKPATGTATKPATTTPKPATTPTTGATKPAGTANTDATTTDSKNAVKKPAPKKKGTR